MYLLPMGFNYWAYVALDWSVDNFEIKRAVTFGRQVIHIHDYDIGGFELVQRGLDRFISAGKTPYADELYAGAKGITLDSLDYSPYENASIIADLRNPPEYNPMVIERQNSYDAVFDIGTSEHVGNPYTSLQNAFSLLRPGGFYFYDLPYTGWLDHGLFQFNPAFFADFCRVNSYLMKYQFIHQTARGEQLFFCRNSTGLNMGNVILSIFGCIQKPPAPQSIMAAPAQDLNRMTLHDIKHSIDSEDILLANTPVFNPVKPNEFIEYLNGNRDFPLVCVEGGIGHLVANKNIFSPSIAYA